MNGRATHPPWHTLSAGEVSASLDSRAAGLSGPDAEARLARHGPNALEPARRVPWHVTARHQFQDPLIYVLLVAAAVTTIQRDVADTIVILAVVLINAIIGFVQERKAQEMVRSLARLSTPRAAVLRDGRSVDIDATLVVPGDVVLLASGAHVPADLRLVDAHDLLVDESLLTGESAAVEKSAETLAEHGLVMADQRNMAFAGTTVVRGRAQGIAVRTGRHTELGAIAHAIRSATPTPTPLQEAFARFGRRVAVGVLGLAAVLILLGLARALPPAEIFLTAVAMAVSAVPEGLPVVLTITLAVGVRRMARRKAVIRSLPAVETLGSTTVIGSDKTGTLTQNAMTVRAIWAGGEVYEVEGIGYAVAGSITLGGTPVDQPGIPLAATLQAGILANEADAGAIEGGEPVGDPTEIALMVVARKAGLHPAVVTQQYRQLDVLPFEAERRYMVSLRELNGRTEFLKGAPEVVLAHCRSQSSASGPIPLEREEAVHAAASLASRGLRILATAYRPTTAHTLAEPVPDDFVLCGFMGMEDPIRQEVPEAIRAAQAAGVRVLMLTGDHLETARVVGARLGLGDTAISGQDLALLSDQELSDVLGDTSVFARVAPEHKLRIVERLKAQNEIVAVTGDGVNDAPALRAAHLGIAMGRSGTDVARDSADMILADDNFATITSAIEEGRAAFANIRRVTFFLLSSAAAEIVAILSAVLVGWPVPLTAIQILWINLVTDSAQAVALAFEPADADLLRQRPRARTAGVLERAHFLRLVMVGLLLGGWTLLVFAMVLEQSDDLHRARSMALTQMVILQFFHLFNCRSLDRSALRKQLGNPFLLASMALTGIVHLAGIYLPALRDVLDTVPPSRAEWAMMLAGGVVVLAAGEWDKWRNRRSGRRLG